MSAVALGCGLISEGVTFSTDGENIRWDNGGDKITPDVIEQLRQEKVRIIAFLVRLQLDIEASQQSVPTRSRKAVKLQLNADILATALKHYGPMSYAMVMRVLGLDGKRAGQVQTELYRQGRIKFDQRGRAYLIELQPVTGSEKATG